MELVNDSAQANCLRIQNPKWSVQEFCRWHFSSVAAARGFVRTQTLSGPVTDIAEPTANDPISDVHSTGLLEHHETELRSPSHCFGPTVRIELGENSSDVKLGGVEGDS